MTADRGARPAAGDLWAITSYFNPVSYRSRRENYRLFRERLSVPIVTVELAYGSEFELGEGDADVLIQLRGGDVLWQKERLLNLAVEALPTDCTKVAILDCDILFGNEDWPERTSQLLDRAAIAHLYSDMHYLPAGATSGSPGTTFAEPKRVSIIAAVLSGLDAEACLEAGNGPRAGKFGTGLAWGARRELLERHSLYDAFILALYDAFILGGADRAMLAGLYGCFDHLVRRHRLNDAELSHFKVWAEPFRQSVGGAIGFLEGDIFHLWHGALADRRWYSRYEPMSRFQFNPFEDIGLTEHGLWRWSTDKPDLHAYVREHFCP